MAEQLNVKMLQRYQPAADWVLQNPILERGEMGVEEDTHKFKFGNGRNHWNDLSYSSSTSFAYVDDTINKNSTNPIQNRAVYNALQEYLPLKGGTLDIGGHLSLMAHNGILKIADYGLAISSDEQNIPIIIVGNSSQTQKQDWLGIKRIGKKEKLYIGSILEPLAVFSKDEINFQSIPGVYINDTKHSVALVSDVPEYSDWINHTNIIKAIGYNPAKADLATSQNSGLMSSTDKIKLDSLDDDLKNYVLPIASTTLGGVKTTSTVTSSSNYVACPIIDGVVYYSEQKVTPQAQPSNQVMYLLGVTESIPYTGGTSSQLYGNKDIYVEKNATGRLHVESIAMAGKTLLKPNELTIGWSDDNYTSYTFDRIVENKQEIVGDEIYQRRYSYLFPGKDGTLATVSDIGTEIQKQKDSGNILSLNSSNVLYIPKLIFTNSETAITSPLSMNAEGFSIANGSNSIWASAGNIGVKWSSDGQWNLNGGGVKCTYLGKEEVALTGNELKFRVDTNGEYTSFNENGIRIPVQGPNGFEIDTKLSATALRLSTGDSYAQYDTASIRTVTGRELPLDQIALLGQVGSGKIKVALVGKNGTFEIKPNMTVLILPWSGSTFYKGDPDKGGTNLGLTSATTSFIISSGKTNADSSMNENGTYYRAAIIYATSITVKSNQNLYETSTPLWFKNAHSDTSGSGNAYIFYTE